MDELMGFIVLSGPILFILIFLILSVFIAIKFSKKGGKEKRFGRGGVIFLLVFFSIFIDEFIGRMYLNTLCVTSAGSKVFNTVELSAEYWDKNNKLNIFNKHGNLKREFWLSNISRGKGSVKKYSSIFSIDKSVSKIIFSDGGALLAEITTFRFWGGWLRRNFSLANGANSCGFIHKENFGKNLYSKIFIQQNKNN